MAKSVDAPEAGFDARARLARVEAMIARRDEVIELQARLLRQAAARLDALERRGQATAPPPAPSLVPIREAAERCGLSIRSIKRLLERGAIVGSAVCVTGSQRRRWLVDPDSLASFLSTPDRKDGPARASRARM